MAHSLSAKKRIRQNVKHNSYNRWKLRSMRESIKEFREKVLHGSAADAKDAFQKACRTIDRSAAAGVIHANQAARRKKRLNATLRTKAAPKA